MKNKVNTQRLSLRQLASRRRVAPSSVLSWVKSGCPRNADKSFDEKAVEAWVAERANKRADGKDLREQKLQAEIDRIQRDIRQRDHDYEESRGEVHSKADCAKSLTLVVSESLQPLLSLHTRVKAKFPELPQNVIDGVAAEVDATMEMIRGGLEK